MLYTLRSMLHTRSGVMRIAYGVVLATAVASAAPPVVSSVRFEQLPNSNIVEIAYDLSDADGDNEFTVTFEVSTDGGRTWGIKPERWSGDAGNGVKAGRGRRIAWDAYGDCGRLRSSRVKIRVLADDGRLPKVKPKPKPRPEPKPQPQTPSPESPRAMKFLRTNAQGYEEYLWLKDSSVMVKIPAGMFTMGSEDGDDDEKPVHQVYLGEYYIDKYEVTNRQYRRFCDATGRGYPSDPDFLGMPNYIKTKPDYPVVCVSWEDAKAYCTWADKRLPTEAEWEKAARGTDARKYPWGNEAPDAGGFYRANWGEGSDRNVWKRDGYEYTAPVGIYERGRSPYGCYDMAGNVWEWCEDWYDKDYYGRSASNNPQGPSSGSIRVVRGGSWILLARTLRCASRIRFGPSNRFSNLGFRCSRRQ